MEILEALASVEAQRRGGLGVVRLAELTGREKSQISRALRVLANAGIVERDPDTLEYQLGWRLFSLVARTADTRLSRVARPEMTALAKEVGETAHLCVLRDTDVLTVMSISPGHLFRAREWEGEVVHAVCTAAGRVLLMDFTLDQLAVRLPDIEQPCREHPSRIRSLAQLWDAIRPLADQGYAVEDEEFEPGLLGVAAPIRDFRGRIVAAIHVSAPKERLAGRTPLVGEVTTRAAARISALLAFQPPSGL